MTTFNSTAAPTSSSPPDTLPIRSDEQIVRLRQFVRENAVAQGLSLVDQTKFVTAASELARNTLIYGGGGDVHCSCRRAQRPPRPHTRIRRQRPGHSRYRARAVRRLHLGQRPRASASAARSACATSSTSARRRARARTSRSPNGNRSEGIDGRAAALRDRRGEPDRLCAALDRRTRARARASTRRSRASSRSSSPNAAPIC